MTKYQTKKGKRHFEGDPVDIHVRFAPNTAGDVADVRERGASVARTGTGEFTITLAQAYKALISHQVTLRQATNTNAQVKLGAYDADAKTLIVHLYKVVCEGDNNDATVAAIDLAYDADTVISVDLTMGASKNDGE